MSTYHHTSAVLPARPSNVTWAGEDEHLVSLYHNFSFYCAIFMVSVCVMGLFGNALSIYVFSRRSMRRSSINTLLLGLSIIDFILVLICPIIFAIPAIADSQLKKGSTEEDLLIIYTLMAYSNVYAYPMAMILQTSSVWIFLVITGERFLAVCRPLEVGLYCTVKRARISLLVVFTLATLYNLVRFWEFDLLNPSTAVGLLRYNETYWLWYGTIAYLITQFAVPFFLIAVLNSTVVHTIYKAKKERARLTNSERSEHRTGMMMLMVVLTFVVCYTLSFVLNISEAADKELFIQAPKRYYAFMLNDASNTLVTFNSASTWIIYLLFSRKYRVLSMRLLFKILPQPILNKIALSEFRALEETTMLDLPGRKNQSCISASHTNTTLIRNNLNNYVAKKSYATSNNLCVTPERRYRSASGSAIEDELSLLKNNKNQLEGSPTKSVHFRAISAPNGDCTAEKAPLVKHPNDTATTSVSDISTNDDTTHIDNVDRHVAVVVTSL